MLVVAIQVYRLVTGLDKIFMRLSTFWDKHFLLSKRLRTLSWLRSTVCLVCFLLGGPIIRGVPRLAHCLISESHRRVLRDHDKPHQ
jgi:hypothetical protein